MKVYAPEYGLGLVSFGPGEIVSFTNDKQFVDARVSPVVGCSSASAGLLAADANRLAVLVDVPEPAGSLRVAFKSSPMARVHLLSSGVGRVAHTAGVLSQESQLAYGVVQTTEGSFPSALVSDSVMTSFSRNAIDGACVVSHTDVLKPPTEISTKSSRLILPHSWRLSNLGTVTGWVECDERRFAAVPVGLFLAALFSRTTVNATGFNDTLLTACALDALAQFGPAFTAQSQYFEKVWLRTSPVVHFGVGSPAARLGETTHWRSINAWMQLQAGTTVWPRITWDKAVQSGRQVAIVCTNVNPGDIIQIKRSVI